MIRKRRDRIAASAAVKPFRKGDRSARTANVKLEAMKMDPVSKLIDMARSQIGYLEKSKAAYEADPSVLDDFKRGAGMDNYTKYARDQWKVRYFNGQKQGVAWCAVFVGWCFLQCFGKDTALQLQCQPRSGNAGAGCGASAKYYKEKGRFSGEPAAGDQIFFQDGNGSVSHTGIVEKVSGGKVFTIEGNSDGMVATHSYKAGSERIYGYGHPDWSIVKESEGDEDKAMARDAIVTRTSTSTGSTVNLRDRASTGGKILAKVPFESTVTVTEDKGDWCKVEYQGTAGWMMANYIEYADMDDDDGEDGYQVVLSVEELNKIEKALKELEEIRGRIGGIEEQISTIVGRG